MSTRPPIPECADCGDPGNHSGRGLCVRCYSAHKRRGTLSSFPSVVESALPDWVDDVTHAGLITATNGELAQRFGVTRRTIERRRARARAKGLMT